MTGLQYWIYYFHIYCYDSNTLKMDWHMIQIILLMIASHWPGNHPGPHAQFWSNLTTPYGAIKPHWIHTLPHIWAMISGTTPNHKSSEDIVLIRAQGMTSVKVKTIMIFLKNMSCKCHVSTTIRHGFGTMFRARVIRECVINMHTFCTASFRFG